MLELEGQWWKYVGAKAARIFEQFAMSETRYYQVLNALLDNPAALAVEPGTVNRLRRPSDHRRDQRATPR
jgi:hypothetical protein